MSWCLAQLPILLLSLTPFGVFVGVVLPAVWSARPSRRQAAVGVLAQLLAAVHASRVVSQHASEVDVSSDAGLVLPQAVTAMLNELTGQVRAVRLAFDRARDSAADESSNPETG